MTSAPTPGGPSWQREPAAPTAESPGSSPFFRWIRGLDITRTSDRWIGGVSGAIAQRTGLDLALVRGLVVILCVFGGIGVLLYGLAWALLPEPDGRIHVEQAGRGSWTSGLTGAAAFVVIGLVQPNIPLLGDGGAGGLLWALFWIGAVVLFVYWIVNRSGRTGRTDGSGPGGPGSSGPGFGGPGAGPTRPFGPAPGGPAPTGPVGGPDMAGPTSAGPASGTSAAATPVPPAFPGADPGAEGANDVVTPPDTSDDTISLPYRPDSLTRPLPTPFPSSGGPATTAWSAEAYGSPSSGYGYSSLYPRGPDSAARGVPSTRASRVGPVRPSGSATALLIGAALIVAAAVLAADYLGVLGVGHPALVACAAAALVLALGVIVLGARGRTSGLVGVAATLALIGGLVASFSSVGGAWVVARDSRTTPATLQTAAEGYNILAAESTIDLTDVQRPEEDVTVPVNTLVSDVTVIVPEDVPVEVRTRVALGAADARGTARDGEVAPRFRSDAGVLQTGDRDLTPDASGPRILLDVTGALSEVTVVTASAADGTSSEIAPPTPSPSTSPSGETP